MSWGRRCSTSGMITISICRYLGGTVPVEPTQKVQVYDRTYRSSLIQTGSLTESMPRSTRPWNYSNNLQQQMSACQDKRKLWSEARACLLIENASDPAPSSWEVLCRGVSDQG